MSDIIQKPKKKRGRKPKGGKIINKELTLTTDTNYKPSIILHLKCNSNSVNEKEYLDYNPDITDIEASNTYDVDFTSFGKGNNIIFNTEQLNTINTSLPIKSGDNECLNSKNIIHNLNIDDYKKIIHSINGRFHNKEIIVSDCFWCTHHFDTPSIHIPKHSIKDKYNVYGFFCSVECAAGFLFNENINMSEKFERYTMLNVLYKDIVNNQNIMPAPSPYYTLSKYCGNMEINDYRNIYTTNYSINCVNNPNSLNIDFPELYIHMNDTSSVHNYDASSGNGFKIKKASKKDKNHMNSYFNL